MLDQHMQGLYTLVSYQINSGVVTHFNVIGVILVLLATMEI